MSDDHSVSRLRERPHNFWSACGTSLAVGANCLLRVTFVPTTAGSLTGTLSIADNATGSPQTVSLSGAAVLPPPTASVAPTSLTFTTLPVGTASAAQTVTLTNTWLAAVCIASIAASGDFAETNTCGTSVAIGAKCTVSVTFTPTTAGSRTGTLTITDNASSSPQTVALLGTASSVVLSSSSQNLSLSSSGGTATATFQISSAQGFTGTVNLACSVTFPGTGSAANPPTCALNPTSDQVTATSPLAATLTVSTSSSGAKPARSGRVENPNGMSSIGNSRAHWILAGAALADLVLLGFLPRRRWRQLWLVLLLALGVGVTWTVIGCGGSSSQGATRGSYQVVVKATSSTVSASTTIALTVQ
jgi:hypothetical protein